MEERIRMNTKSLQKEFKSVYEQFFAKNDLVVSWSFSFSRWTMGIWHRSQHLRIKSKLPIKMYIWITKNTTNTININSVSIYDILSNSFKEESFDEIFQQKEEIINILYDFLKDNKSNTWINISILSESPRWHSLGFAWTFWAIVSTWIHIITWKIDKSILHNSEDFEKSNMFKEVWKLWQKIDFVARHSNLGVNSLFPLLKSDFPYIFYGEKFNNDIDINNVWNIKYTYFPLDKILNGNKNLKFFPLDIAIIFAGKKQKTDIIEHALVNDKIKCDELWEFIQHDLLKNCDFAEDINFYKFKDKGFIYEQFSNTATIMGIKTIELLKKIYIEWLDKHRIDDFIDQINVLRNVLSLVERQESFAEDFLYEFKNNQPNKNNKLGIRPIYSGKNGWWYMLVMKEESRDVFTKTIHKLNELYSNIAIIHASWLDSKNTDGIIVHQYVSMWIFSKYMNKNKVFLKTNFWQNKMWEYNELLSSTKDGLLLDIINNKIYINWRKLSSKDIPSQTTTIHILNKLIDSAWKDIPNTEFEISSYTKNKNEMIGKIVLPLIVLIEKEIGEKLPLICKGSIYDFYVKLNPTDIKISIINKI